MKDAPTTDEDVEAGCSDYECADDFDPDSYPDEN